MTKEYIDTLYSTFHIQSTSEELLLPISDYSYTLPKSPCIFEACYAGINVYELGFLFIKIVINNCSVMRRRDGSWVNATHILKLAGIDKGRRTKILEEFHSSLHEKIQGGYGKYQGTWVLFY